MRTTATRTTTPRLRPSLAVALAVVVAYGVVAIGLQVASGLNYDTWFDSASNVVRAVLPAFGAGTVLLVAVATWLRWDHVWRDPERMRMGALLWLPVVLMLLSIALTAAGADWSGTDASLLVTSAVALVLVALCEELLFRGLLLRGARESMPEAAAVGLTAATFGCFHLVNLALGAPAGQTVAQVVSAGFGGISYYLVRRATGYLWAPVLVHAAYDLSVVPEAAGDASLAELAQLLTLPTWILCLVALASLSSRSSEAHPRKERGPAAGREDGRGPDGSADLA